MNNKKLKLDELSVNCREMLPKPSHDFIDSIVVI